MPDMTVSRKQRLRTLENEIRSGMEEFYYTGMKLKEIRDDELYKEDGFDTWERYCRERWDWSSEHCRRLIVASEYRAKLPTPPIGGVEWSEGSVRELTRLEDKRDAAKVAAKVIKAVEQSEKEAAKDPEIKPIKLTAALVRKFVDADLGVDRGAKAQKTKRQREEESKPELHRFLIDMAGRLEAEVEMLDAVADNREAWKLLRESHPGVMKRFIEACDSLAVLIERIGR